MAKQSLHDTFNILLAGDIGVGKTSFAFRFSQNIFVSGVDLYSDAEGLPKRHILIDGVEIETDLLDTWASYEQRGSGLDANLHEIRRAHACILVYSVNKRCTFEDVVQYYKQVRRVKGQPSTVFALVGNQCDLAHLREVSAEEGAALAHELDCHFFETSAKTGENVELAIASVIRQLLSSSQKVPSLVKPGRLPTSIAAKAPHWFTKYFCCR